MSDIPPRIEPEDVPEIRIIEPERPTVSPEELARERALTRRQFVERMALIGVGAVGTVVLGKLRQSIEDATKPPAAASPSTRPGGQQPPNRGDGLATPGQLADQEKLRTVFETGIRQDWQQFSLFPGMILASPGVQFFARPDLAPESKLDLAPRDGERWGILRPIFVDSTIGLNFNGLTGDTRAMVEQTPVLDGTMAFWLPNSGQLGYFNYNDEIEHLEPGGRVPIGFGGEGAYGLIRHNVEIDGRRTFGQNIVPYLEFPNWESVYPIDPATGREDYRAEPEEVKTFDYKLIAQTATYTTPEAATNAMSRFQGAAGYEPLEMPK